MKIIGNAYSSMAVFVAAIVLTQSAYAAQITRFSNTGSIINTRHNMTQSTMFPNMANIMDAWRNQYGEVCVYCHTPHGASNTIAAPLWNRTTRATNYQTYNELGTSTLTQDVLGTPGPASLTCLSCHDGQTAIDSVINMPSTQILTGSVQGTKHGNGLQSQETTQSTAFLNSWTNPAGHSDSNNHQGLNSNNGVLSNGSGPPGAPSKGCLSCHTPGYGSGQIPDFGLFNIGTDLRNDHPIGVTFPAAAIAGTNNEDFNQPAGLTAQGGSNYFDENGDSKMQKNEIRTYDGRVECASCHDPHGVVPPGAGLQFNPTFLRKPQEAATPSGVGSRVCFTCHNK